MADKDATPHISMLQDMQSKLAPVLEKLSGCYSPVARSNPHIFVCEDNTWSIKGQYINAIMENETIEWIASPSGQLTLPILMSYAKYLAIEDTTSHIKQYAKDKLWTEKMPSHEEIHEVFVSQSGYFKYYHKAFPLVSKHPELEKWLKEDPTAQFKLEVWGLHKPGFRTIPIVIQEYIDQKKVQDKEKKKEKKKSKHLKKNLT
ncbi:hypothetical protein BDQ12DRAFT_667633 [Crucibulum laeve]|uniref:Uncharacterized protein n=1 Tax=Crucibulum laeve TaxID=68775 RepID=A0A5C3LVJ9_9AGAR|nr:hypothetical protein BDQ12DRAFT_667633 [Crucibulum laeve]